MQVPGNRVPSNFQCSSAGILADSILADLEVEWTLPSGAEIQTL